MKHLKKLAVALLMVCLAASWAVAGVKVSGLIVEIVPETGVDFNLNDYVPGGMVVDSITFKPSAADDVLIFREGSATGPRFFPVKDGGYGSVFYGSGGMLHPFLKASDCTFATPANVIISIKMR